MIRRYWIVTCDYCGREQRFNGNTKPSDARLKESGIVFSGLRRHFCSEACASDWSHDKDLKRAENLKQFRVGKKFERI